jgi:hypothetical protein
MGQISIVAYRPKPGREGELRAVLDSRLPLLRRLGLATERARMLMRSKDGTLIEASEWASEAAIAKAHQTPEALALWERFNEVCAAYVELRALAECGEMFATFEAVE